MGLSIKTLVLGNGPCALQTAKLLADQGFGVIIANREQSLACPEELVQAVSNNPGVELLNGYCLENLTRHAGQFEACMVNSGAPEHRLVSSIVVAEENNRISNAALYGLQFNAGTLSLTQLRQQLSNDASKLKDKNIAFLSGLFEETNAVVAGEALQGALDLQQVTGAQGYFFTTNLKVAANGLEKKYHDAKAAGCLFFKFSQTMPEINLDRNGAVTIEFEDEVNGIAYSLTPDLFVVDETVIPSGYLSELARVMQLDTDQLGFVQTANVHRLTVSTNCRGIYAAGPSRAVMSAADAAVDAANAVEAIIRLQSGASDIPSYKAEIDTGQCIACLTCFRLCPYKAVLKGHCMNVLTDACEGCGICAAECPRGAIAMDGLGGKVDQQIGTLAAEKKMDGVPAIFLFCCSRSAYRAGSLAACLEYQLPGGLTTIVVPCAGGISIQHLLAAFRGGADGVMVMTCHTDNCHSENGNSHARRRIELLTEKLPQMGVPPARLEIHTLAANMPREFANITLQFEEKLKEALR
jgi:coenzyme F420-reducing hydrogenase delta subunit/Pyruvate/2-oxoacid:ferredoxin oxidoreductase delta subunit